MKRAILIVTMLSLFGSMLCIDIDVKAAEPGKQNVILEGLLQHITPSGQTIRELVLYRETNMIGDVDYDDPEWDVQLSEDGKAVITCIQTATFYTEGDSPNIGGAEVLHWFFDGENYYSVLPNDLNDGLPDIERPENAPETGS
jgi:hypothetical protein